MGKDGKEFVFFFINGGELFVFGLDLFLFDFELLSKLIFLYQKSRVQD